MGADQRPHSDPGGVVCGVWGHPHWIALELCSVGTERGTVFGRREGEPSWIQAYPHPRRVPAPCHTPQPLSPSEATARPVGNPAPNVLPAEHQEGPWAEDPVF